MRFGDPSWLNLFWVLPILGVLLVRSWWVRARLARRFADSSMLGELRGRISGYRRVLKFLLVMASLGAVTTALARPQWGAVPEEVKLLGRDVCFVVDVSRSMMARDLAPNRLERAKLWIDDALELVEGDRVGLVAFAGTASVRCPLTHDYGFFKIALDELSPLSASRGGTYIGDAIRVAMREVFDLEEASKRDIILITDGEDHDSFPKEAAAAAGEAGIRLIVIGIGDENEGTPIPIRDENGRLRYLEYQGERVYSRLDADTLREMAVSTPGGRYFNVATGNIQLDQVYKQLIREADQREIEAEEVERYEEKFQIFLGIALTLLLLEGMVHERKSSG